MEYQSASKVGSLVIVGILLGLALWLYLSHIRPNTYKVTVNFADTKGLSTGNQVRMQGVSIGEVSKIDLDTSHAPFTAAVILTIDKKYNIPEHYVFTIVTGLLINTSEVDINPPAQIAGGPPLPKNGSARVTGAPTPGMLEQISPQLSGTLTNLNGTVKDLQTRLDVLTGKLNNLVDNTTTLVKTGTGTINSARSLVADPKLHRDLIQTMDNFRTSSQQLVVTSKDLSTQLHDTLSSSRGKIDRLANTAIDLSVKLGNTIDDAREVVRKLTEEVSDPRLQQSLQETLELARSTLASARQITSDVHQLTGDPTLMQNLKQTVANLDQLTSKSSDAMDRVNTLLNRLTGAAGKVKKPTLPKVNLLTNISEQMNPGKFRLDLDARVPFGQRSLFNAGLYDLGENTRLDLQFGNNLTDQLLVRYGIYASKIGAGLEYAAPAGFGLRADLYDPNHPRLDVRGLIRVNKNASLWVGGQSIFDNPSPAVGVQFTP